MKTSHLAFLVALAAAAPVARAQSYDSGSNGSDGALTLSGTGDLVFDPRSFAPPLDPDGDGVYHFTTITIPSGLRVVLRASVLGDRPVVWLAQGAVVISGELDLSADPVTNDPGPGGGRGGRPGGGGPGAESLDGTPGDGPGGGQAGLERPGIEVDGYSPDPGHFGSGARRYGNPFLKPLVGGSGGGGSAGTGFEYYHRGGLQGGSSGGAILIASSTEIHLTGTIRANGHFIPSTAVGQPGSGGAVRLVAPRVGGVNARVEALGGELGGTVGDVGRIRIETLDQGGANVSTSPEASRGRSSPVGLPATAPTIRVVSVGGQPVPPNGGLTGADVRATGTVSVVLEARNAPPGMRVVLRLVADQEQQVVVQSTPLVGTFEQSTATASLTLPSRQARVFVTLAW